ncbi:uncharacterized protein [Parasteatoda tepidariorum]|uniref:uncharacterized protein isoform X2 n=1 Tax=Parasteatoda tepidariorum TaxID=114398 RepID=UPI001C71D299|nr:uncharacterized protein LOC107456328 isoform X2 [Parasteatoda tepidariorum]
MWPEMKSKIYIVTSHFPPNGNNDSRTILNVLKGVPFLKQAATESTIGNIIADMNSSYCQTSQISKKTGMATNIEEEETKFQALTTIPSYFLILQQSFQPEQNSPVITLFPVQVNCSNWEFVLSALSLGTTLAFYDEEHREDDGHNLWHYIDRYKVRYALIMENHKEFLRRPKIQPNPKSSFQFLSRITVTKNSISELQKKYLLKYLKKDSKLRNINCNSVHRKHLRSKESIERIVKNGYHLFSEADTVRRLQTSPRKSPTYSPPCFCTLFIYIFIVWMWRIYSE